jgi:hypothetical protein
MSDNSYTSFEKEHEISKMAYVSQLRNIIAKKNNQTLQQIDVLDYLEIATKYFSLTENYSHKILDEKDKLKGFAVSSFSVDCFAILEYYLLHI